MVVTEKEIVYFIMSHTVESANELRKFMFPVLPHPDMGEEFMQKIKEQFEEVEEWIKNNPDKFRMAELGFYLE